ADSLARHSSRVRYSQLTPVKITRSGLAARSAQGDSGFIDHRSLAGSAHSSTKACERHNTCQRPESSPSSKPALNQSPVTDTPMTCVQVNAGGAAGTGWWAQAPTNNDTRTTRGMADILHKW